MLSRIPTDPLDTAVHLLDGVELFQLCAGDKENSDAWAEFLRRYAGKMNQFISGVLRQFPGSYQDLQDAAESGSVQESDLFQNIILRLVEKDCAVMKKFSGKTENDLLAYLAVICRSSVLDSLRRSRACKRRPATAAIKEAFLVSMGYHLHAIYPEFEREILFRELIKLARQTIHSHSGSVSRRDQLVFDLHFFDGLSCGQIAQCRGVKLSKAGVEKLLKRLVDRVQSLASAGKSGETLQ
jgi:RNA polymerase sigma factor (sigma-70 family)